MYKKSQDEKFDVYKEYLIIPSGLLEKKGLNVDKYYSFFENIDEDHFFSDLEFGSIQAGNEESIIILLYNFLFNDNYKEYSVSDDKTYKEIEKIYDYIIYKDKDGSIEDESILELFSEHYDITEETIEKALIAFLQPTSLEKKDIDEYELDEEIKLGLYFHIKKDFESYLYRRISYLDFKTSINDLIKKFPDHEEEIREYLNNGKIYNETFDSFNAHYIELPNDVLEKLSYENLKKALFYLFPHISQTDTPKSILVKIHPEDWLYMIRNSKYQNLISLPEVVWNLFQPEHLYDIINEDLIRINKIPSDVYEKIPEKAWIELVDKYNIFFREGTDIEIIKHAPKKAWIYLLKKARNTIQIPEEIKNEIDAEEIIELIKEGAITTSYGISSFPQYEDIDIITYIDLYKEDYLRLNSVILIIKERIEKLSIEEWRYIAEDINVTKYFDRSNIPSEILEKLVRENKINPNYFLEYLPKRFVLELLENKKIKNEYYVMLNILSVTDFMDLHGYNKDTYEKIPVLVKQQMKYEELIYILDKIDFIINFNDLERSLKNDILEANEQQFKTLFEHRNFNISKEQMGLRDYMILSEEAKKIIGKSLNWYKIARILQF